MTPAKIRAKHTVIDFFRRKTGLNELPHRRTTIALQKHDQSFESAKTNPYVASKFLGENQFIAIESRREWVRSYPGLVARRPLLVDLDVGVLGTGREAIDCLQQTMIHSPDDCLIAYSFLVRNAYHVCSFTDVIEALHRAVPSRILKRRAKDYGTFTYATVQVILFSP
jgi:hypothetical protein